MNPVRILLMVVVPLLATCHSLPPLPSWQGPEGLEHADLNRILDLREGQQLTPRQLLAELAAAERILVGERHDNPDHHALQLWLLQALAQQREQGSLLLEMLDPVQQPRVEAVKASIAKGDWPEDLPAELGWQKGWDWSLYGPLVKHALAQPYPLLQANLDRDEISAIYRQRPEVTGPPAAAEVQQALFEQIRRSHCDMLPEAQLPAMLAVQQQRDRRMAERLQAAPAPAMLLAGVFHVRRDVGVPLHLNSGGDRERTKVLILAEVGERVEAAQADFVWFTPKQPEKDYCAALRHRD